MTREETIEILKELWRYERTAKFSEKQIREALEIAKSAVEMQKTGQWIPVSDPLNELPTDRRVLVTVLEEEYDYRYVTEVYWDMTEWSDNYYARNAIAYMSYPEPYEADKEEEK